MTITPLVLNAEYMVEMAIDTVDSSGQPFHMQLGQIYKLLTSDEDSNTVTLQSRSGVTTILPRSWFRFQISFAQGIGYPTLLSMIHDDPTHYVPVGSVT